MRAVTDIAFRSLLSLDRESLVGGVEKMSPNIERREETESLTEVSD